MTGFGEDLRAEREARGVSLDQLCAETKVSLRHLQALEREEYGQMPGGVFRKGIFRSYLAALHIEEHAWMPRFLASLGEHGAAAEPPEEEAWVAFAENVQRNRTHPADPLRFRWLGVLALFVLLVAVAWAVWHYLVQPAIRL